MNKATLEKLIKNTENVKDVVITTNILKGYGINGVNNTIFHTYLEEEEGEVVTTTKIELHDECVEFVITKTNKNAWYWEGGNHKCGKKITKVTTFVPYENIVMVTYDFGSVTKS